jgi:16S rRNA (cytosine1402-N4)-methyltransferase
MDKDAEAIAAARAEFAHDPRVRIQHDSFAALDHWPETAAGLDGVLFDLGVSSPQLDQAQRGFSFAHDGPLDMRMDTTRGPTAAQWLADASEIDIADALWQYGEERLSRRIARAIVAQRALTPIETTRALAALVEKTIGFREPGKHPATRTFQALRIVVNREIEDLQRGLEVATARLKAGGRLVVISFHSLEDRAVKHFMRDNARSAPSVRRGLPPPIDAPKPRLRVIGDAQKPGADEVAANPRARSAVLRVAERVA